MCAFDVLILSIARNHEYCKSYEAIKIELPEEGSKISFKNHNRSMRVRFIAYADFESFTSQLSTCQPNLRRATPSSIRNIFHRILLPHKVFDDALYYSQQPVTFVKEFNDDDVVQIFIDTLERNL